MKIHRFLGKIGAGVVLCFIAWGCANIPEGATAVSPFDVNQYKGKWYEIARFDFKFEKNMKNVTAQYSLNEDGTIKVLNTGYDTIAKEWKTAEGHAKFVSDANVARLKVSFFGPFYSGYNVVMMEPDYENALVMGNDTDYIWFLSRKPTMPDSTRMKFIQKAKEIGYDTSRLIFTIQDGEKEE